MIGLRVRLLQLLTFVVLIALGFTALRTLPLRAQPPRGQDVYQDFRGSKPLTDEWKMIGQNREADIKPEDGGLRITLPKAPKGTQPVGVRLMFPLSGDFEITCAYQLLSADRPPLGGGGVGVAFNLIAQPDQKKFVRFGRFVLPSEEDVYVAECRLKDSPQDYQMKTVPTKSRAGKLRLVREGSKLRYLVADDPPDVFREIHSGVFTDEELENVRIGVNNNNSPSAVDVRLVDVKIRTGNRPVDQAEQQGEQGAHPTSRWWLIVALLLGITVTLIFAGAGLFMFLRRGRRASELSGSAKAEIVEEKQSPSPPASSISVRCAACGKNLKLKAAAAGKKIKCPQCGKVVLAPAI